MAKPKSLPNIKEHLQDTWDRLTIGLLPAFVIAVIAFLVALVVMAVFGVLAFAMLASGVGIMESLSSPGIAPLEVLSMIPKSAYLILGLLFLVLLVIVMVVGSISQAGQIMAFADSKKKPKVKDLLNKSIKVVPALVGLSIVTFFLAIGSIWLLFFPVLLVGLFLTFSIYEVVLEGTGPLQAIKESVAMVADNFGYVLDRLLLFVGAYLVIFVVLPEIADEFSVITLILSFFWGWFSFSYMVSMYQAIKEAGYDKKQSIWWLWALAIVGWGVFILGFLAVKSLVGSELMDQVKREAITEMEPAGMIDSDQMKVEGLDRGEFEKNIQQLQEINQKLN